MRGILRQTEAGVPGQGDEDVVCIKVTHPAIDVTKECDGAPFVIGQPIRIRGTIRNTGDETLVGVTLVDSVTGPITLSDTTLSPGETVQYSFQYTPAGSGAQLCGPFRDTVTATGQGECSAAIVRDTAEANCPVITSPCIEVTKDCQPRNITLGQTYNITATVRNCGNVPLRDVVVTDNLNGVVTTIATIPLLNPSATPTALGPFPVTPTECVPSRDTVNASGIDICTGQRTDAAPASCEVIVSCPPQIRVLKEVACVQPGGTCPASGYAKTATGVRDGTCPAFCYRITVSNPGTVPLVNITLSDPSLNLTACNAALAGVTLQPGQSTTPCITGPVEHCTDYVNTVTARGASAVNTSDTVTNTDTASVIIRRIDVTCDLTLFSSFNVEGSCDVNLPQDSVNTPITFIVTVCNNGNSPLNVTSLGGLPVLEDCLTGAPTTIPLPFSLAAGQCLSFTNCTRVSCPEGARYNVSVHAEADDVGGTVCVYDNQGNRVSDDSACQACVGCAVTPTCRVTGGGQLIPNTFDESCIRVDTTIFPFTSPNGLTIKKITHGGQLGAPFSQMDCVTNTLGNPCIRGQWQHTRHYEGQANPRDVFDMNFHSVTPKGQFDTLNCACLGCCDPASGVFIPPSVGPLIHKFALCNPDDHKVCGPQPRPAPANAIIFTGVGKMTPTDDVRGSRAAQAEWVVFRVYIEDRSEPGGFHPKGAVEPADIYCFQAWKTGIKVSKKPDFSTVAPEFRMALTQHSCDFLDSLSNGALPIGSLPDPTVIGASADVQDCGAMHDGNHQIHPATGATCDQ